MLNGYLLARWLHRPVKEVVEVVRTVDTLERITQIETERILPGKIIRVEHVDTLYLTDTLQIPPEELAQRRIYSDTIEQDGAKLHYRHSVIGALEHSTYAIQIPERTIVDREVKTVTQTVAPSWQVFGSAHLQGNQFSVGGAIYREGIGVHYQYTPQSGSHQLGVGVRLLQW